MSIHLIALVVGFVLMLIGSFWNPPHVDLWKLGWAFVVLSLLV